MSPYLLPLSAPLLLLAAAAFGWACKGRRPPLVPAIAEGAALGAMAIAIASLAVLSIRRDKRPVVA